MNFNSIITAAGKIPKVRKVKKGRRKLMREKKKEEVDVSHNFIGPNLT